MNGLPPALIPSLVALLMIVLVVRRSLSTRQLRMDRMWLFPAVLLLITAYMFIADPPRDPQTIGILAAAAALGGAVGWHRGRLTRITHDPETGVLTAQPSVAAAVLIVAVFALRFGLRFWMMQTPGVGHGHWAVVGSNALLLSTVGVLTVQRIEMYLRCRKLVAQGLATA